MAQVEMVFKNDLLRRARFEACGARQNLGAGVRENRDVCGIEYLGIRITAYAHGHSAESLGRFKSAHHICRVSRG